ncbi:MAG: FG-GAP-like repeat-containing protein [Saprospiraceae bacterium]
MKSTFLFILLFTALQLRSQDFTLSPYQDFGLAAPIVGDFNGDDKTDLLGIHSVAGTSYIGLLVNDGSSPLAFSEKDLGLTFKSVGLPAAADLDGDSDLDVLVAKGTALNLFMLHNDGAANFTADSLGVAGSNVMKVADTDNDGDLDIVGINTATSKLRLYLNDGTQHFTTKNITTSTIDLVFFDIADMDNDGDVDIVLGFYNFTDLHIALYKNTGGNNFESVNVAYNTYSSIEGLLIDDINNDGKKDIIAIKTFSCDAFINQGNLSFTQKNLINPGAIIRSVHTGDFNGDGRRDIVLGKNSTDITWHKNLSNTTLEFETHAVGGVSPCFSVTSGDLDSDGDEDIVVHNGNLWWYENNVMQEPSGTVNFSDYSVVVSPNPFTDFIQLKNTGQDAFLVNVTDYTGRNVYSATVSAEFIDLSKLSPGIYLLSLINTTTHELRSTSIVKGN